MKIIEPGHVYRVQHVDGHPLRSTEICFVRRRGSDGRLLPEAQRSSGILGQELLRVLIDRTLYLNAEDPCTEDVEIVGKLRECLRLYEARAARKTIEKMPMPERADACPICHHLLCDHRTPDRLEHG
jgi:hypothetical protein